MAFGLHWRAIQREAQLAAEQVARGVTELGRANHAEVGSYTQAFFGLSNGFERMGKLVFVADHAIGNAGVFPADNDLRAIGHDLSNLLPKCEAIGNRLDPKRKYAVRPCDLIHQGIEEAITLFATSLRYYNLRYLAGSAGSLQDPIEVWWQKVAKPICDRHYTERVRKRDALTGAMMEQVFAGSVAVSHTGEDGSSITDIRSYASRGGMTGIIQKYGRLYTLQIARWLAGILFELSHIGAYGHRIEALLGLHEPFAIFYNDDGMFQSRKYWTIYPR